MFTGSGLLNLFKVSTVFAAPENSVGSERKDRKNIICQEDIKKERLREIDIKPGDLPKTKRSGNSEGTPRGRQERRSTSPRGRSPARDRGGSPRGKGERSARSGSKDAGDSRAAPAAAAATLGASAAGDQAAGGTATGDKMKSVSRSDKGYGGGAKGGGVGDLGTAGAGLTGSRADVDSVDDVSLPAGAVYPGLLRHIHNAARYTLPQCFEGATVSVKQATNNNWVLGHSMSFSSVSPGGYKLLLSYMDKSKPSALPYFVMETAPGGQMSCEFRVGPTQNSRATFMSQVSDAEFKSFESVIDLYFSNATASMIAVNREFIAVHYLQGLSKRVSVGAEVVARGPVSELRAGSGALRWASDHVAVSGTLGNRGLDLCYARALKPHLTVAAMLEVGFAIRRAVATLAYEWRAEDWVFRGSVDSDGLVGGALQHRLGGRRSHLACALSALLNHPNDKFRLGFGITAAII